MAKRSKVISVHPCDSTAQVVTVNTPAAKPVFRREVCAECPWRRDSPPGAFPAEAYRHSAKTCVDMATSTFSCHMSGAKTPATCAGFLLSKDADHNMQVRLSSAREGIWMPGAVKRTAPTYDSYYEMAVANGVDPDDPAIRACRTQPEDD